MATLFAVVVFFLIYQLASRSLPEFSGEVTQSIGDYQLEILRDSQSVPHIYGARDKDVFFGLGYAHAQDRLWQMTLMRRTAQGKLSEIFGEDTLPLDKFLRALNLWSISLETTKRLDAETMDNLQAYSDGVNAYLQEIQENSLGRGAPEFFVFGREIAAWAPADSVALIKLMALQLSDQANQEILFAEAAALLPPQRVLDLFPDSPIRGINTILGTGDLAYDPSRREPELSELAKFLNPVPEIHQAGASNAFAAAPSRTANGASLLANDPHLEFTAPIQWMLAHLELPSGRVIGGTLPGIPSVIIGRSDYLAWGLTTSYLDDQDLYIEKIDPNDPNRYITATGSKPFQSQNTEIWVDGKDEPEVFTRLSTENGPVLPANGVIKLGPVIPDGHVAALAWTALEVNDKSIKAAFDLLKAKNVTQAIAALENHQAPAQMFTLADKNSVAMIAAGKIPNRNPQQTSQGRIPTPGWLENNAWNGYQDYSNNPRLVNPDEGLLLHTNNRFYEGQFPNHYSFFYGDSYRILRAENLLGKRPIHTSASFAEAQVDTISHAARALVPLVARDFFYQDFDDPLKETALSLLAEWNGDMDVLSAEPLIYAEWMRQLQHFLIRDELGKELSERFVAAEPSFIERVYRNVGGAADWCDIKPTSIGESCTEIADRALGAALERLSKTYGPNIETWRWGIAHPVQMKNPVLGDIPFLSLFGNIVVESGGGNETLLRAKSSNRLPEPFVARHGAGLRIVVDFSNLETSKMIIATGQSGHVLSSHYDDLTNLWRRGEYIYMSMDRDFIEKTAHDRLVISPLGVNLGSN